VRLVPRWAWIFYTLSNEVVGVDRRTICIDDAVVKRGRRSDERKCRVATGIEGRRPCRNVELRQSVERLIGKSVLRPIFTESSKVMIERAILLNHEDDVIDALQATRPGKGGTQCR